MTRRTRGFSLQQLIKELSGAKRNVLNLRRTVEISERVAHGLKLPDLGTGRKFTSDTAVAAAQVFGARSQGGIINLSSIAVLHPEHVNATYSAAKAFKGQTR
jgi:NAD(P)-dependent dehydrogenase (short-subunit alcohol dehydrogenase family)